MNVRFAALISVIIALVVILSTIAFIVPHFSQGYTGTLNTGDLGNLTAIPPGVSVSGNTIYINSSLTVSVEMGPMMQSVSMYSFMVYGQINPELVIHSGLHINFMEVNVDNDSYHNFAITTAPPPYPYMVMSSMMNGGHFMLNEPMLPPESGGIMHYSQQQFTAGSPGTYWYICTYPGHAESGMYGKILVA